MNNLHRGGHIWYDTETVAIVHRSRGEGLTATEVLIWRGSLAVESDAIATQARKLANQYVTLAIPLRAGHEHPDLVGRLGGTLIIRAVRPTTPLACQLG